MRDQNNIPNEYPESWDDGTYQTGATPDRKGQSGLITGLLIATIFLGGIASALGVMNVRLLEELGRQKNPVLPVAVDASGGPAESFLRENQQSVPNVPKNGSLELKIGTSSPILSREALLSQASACVASVTVQTAQGQEMAGQALILSSDGYLLINAHLLGNGSAVAVRLPGGEILQAAVVGSDAYSDLAVLYVQVQGLTAATFANAAMSFAPGKESYGLNGRGTLVAGNLLSDGREIAVGGDTIALHKTDFTEDHGPVFDSRGQVRGFLCRPFGGEEGGWMLHVSQLADIAAELVEKGTVSGRPGWTIQVKELSNFCRQYWNLNHGLEVASVTEGSAARESGLLSGDILLTLNGQNLTGRSRLCEILLDVPAGGSVTLEVFRAGQTFTVTIPVTESP